MEKTDADYQELFNYMYREHGLILLCSEMSTIIGICQRALQANETRETAGTILARQLFNQEDY